MYADYYVNTEYIELSLKYPHQKRPKEKLKNCLIFLFIKTLESMYIYV